jgi:superfamily II DNA or RNA helicase
MTFAAGSLVRVRGREWVVLPESNPDEQLLMLRPLGGTDDEIVGIYTPLAPVVANPLPPPDPTRDRGNHHAAKLLMGALRLGFRAGAGPFRSLARIAIEPRPYQLVPLLMAMQLDPVRLLIADDVGVGKTIEALLIARELFDRGELRSIAVLCPPHLAEQWQRAMHEQFHFDVALVLAGTAGRLEKRLPAGESIFEHHPITVVSMDFIKSDRRRHEFLRCCPELVIVDEAHTCTAGQGQGSQRRHGLLQDLAADPERNLILVTATPHSGNEAAFRSLLGLLDRSLLELPPDLSGEANRSHREQLARHLVQRRRGDIDHFLDAKTPFPKRESTETNYLLAKPYRDLFDRVLAYCREQVRDPEVGRHRQRIRWWSALALLRALASSPAAAAATLRKRAAPADSDTPDEADELGRRAVMDLEEDGGDDLDVAPGGQSEAPDNDAHRRRLLAMAREAEALVGSQDTKLAHATKLVRELLAQGCSPILFCRFIPTAHYVAEALRKALPAKISVMSITGELPPEERETRVATLAEAEHRVLVCTDCLSEGINLQDGFDAVLHYDLSWNPTRHEQREGRVDRYGQPKPVVRAVTFYGQDNPVDGIVLHVLLRKHAAIRSQLGINVPVPMDTNAVTEAIFEGLLMRENDSAEQTTFEFAEPERKQLDLAWSVAADREKRSRVIFAQHAIKLEAIERALAETRRAIGDHRDLEAFVHDGVTSLGGQVKPPRAGHPAYSLLLQGTHAALRDAMGLGDDSPDGPKKAVVPVVFEPPANRGVALLTRTHPLVEGLASYLFQGALDPSLADADKALQNGARRCSAIRTTAVAKRTTVLLLRLRLHLITRGRDSLDHPLLAEDLALVGFEGVPGRAEWLAPERALELLDALPTDNLAEQDALRFFAPIMSELDALAPKLEQVTREHAERLRASHADVRRADRRRGIARGLDSLRVDPHPPDILGVFLLVPDLSGSATTRTGVA